VGELKALREEVAGRIAEVNRQIDDGVLAATQDPKRPERLPAKEAPAPYLNFAPLDNAAESLARAAARFERAQGTALGANVNRATAAAVNGLLKDVERTLTSDEGLPRRPWYRHLLYAPGYYTGYGVKTMPAAREAIEQKQWAEADREMARIAAAMEAAAAQITRAAERLENNR
jgi:N-acetylated-alpha-linked acidic dipeptidase